MGENAGETAIVVAEERLQPVVAEGGEVIEPAGRVTRTPVPDDHRRRSVLHLEQQALRILETFLDAHQEADRLAAVDDAVIVGQRSEEHTSELQSLMRISYAVFCLKKKTKHITIHNKHLSQPQHIDTS